MSDLFPLIGSDEDADGPVTRHLRQIGTTPGAIDRERLAVRMALSDHDRALRTISRLTNGVIVAVLAGSISVVTSIAAASWYLSARMERLENIAARVDRIEAALSERR